MVLFFRQKGFGLVQHRLGVACGFDRFPPQKHGAVGVDDEGAAFDAHGFFAVEGFFAPGTSRLHELVVWVTGQRHGDAQFFDKPGVTIEGVGTDADDFDA